MRVAIFFRVFDLFITCFELGGYFYLTKEEKRKKSKYNIGLYFILLLIGITIMSILNLPILLKYSIIIGLMTIGGSIVFDNSIFKNFLYGIIYTFSIQCSETIAIHIWQMVNPLEELKYFMLDRSVISLVIASKGIYFLFITIFQKILQKDIDNKTKLTEIVPIIVSGIPFIMVLECLNVILPYIKDSKSGLFSLGCSMLILLVFVFDMIFTQYYNSIRKKALFEEHTIYELQLKYDYYKNKKEDEAVIREIYHDLKNYFLIYKDDFISEELRRKLSAYESYYMTGNELLDVIISDKLRKAYSSKIQIECKVDFKEGGFIEALDISTIFGNLLDNAIEACVRLPEEERFIWINVGKKRQFILIQVRNTAVNGGKTDSNSSITDKPNRYLHGFGIPNIKKAVRKYDGECKITASNDGIFEITIVIPILNAGEMNYVEEKN